MADTPGTCCKASAKTEAPLSWIFSLLIFATAMVFWFSRFPKGDDTTTSSISKTEGDSSIVILVDVTLNCWVLYPSLETIIVNGMSPVFFSSNAPSAFEKVTKSRCGI